MQKWIKKKKFFYFIFLMLWIFSLLSQLFLGFQIASIANPTDGSILIVLALSVPFGITISTFIYFFCSPFFGQNVFNLILNTILNVALSIFAYLFRYKSRKKPISIKKKDLLFPLIYAILISYFLYMCYYHKSEMVESVISYYLHEEYSLIASFYKGCNSGRINPFSLRHPDHFKAKLSGKCLPALHSSMLMQGGASIQISLLFPMILMSLSFCIVQQYFCRKLRIKEICIYFIPFITFSICSISCFDLRSFHMKKLIQIYYVSQNPRENIFHENPLIAMFAGTPSVIYSATITIALISSLFNRKSQKTQIIVSFFAGAILPSSVSGSFYAMLIFIFFYLLQDIRRSPKYLFAPLFVGSLLNLHRIIIQVYFRSQHFEAFQFGTMFPRLTYWYTLTGLLLPIAFISYFLLKYNEKRILSSVFLSFLIISSISFNRENCANLPVYYSFFIPLLVPYFFITLMKIYRDIHSEESKGLFIAFCCFLIFIHCNLVITFPFSSQEQISGNSDTKKVINSQNQIDLASWIILNTNKTDIFITYPSVYDPVTTIAGRIVYAQDEHVSLRQGYNVSQRLFKIELLKDNPCDPLFIPEAKYFVTKNVQKQIAESERTLNEKKRQLRIDELFKRRNEKILNEKNHEKDKQKKVDYGAFVETAEESLISDEELGITSRLWMNEEQELQKYKRELLDECAWKMVYSNDDYLVFQRHEITIL